MGAFTSTLERSPWSLDEMMMGIDFYTDAPKQIVLILPAGSEQDATEVQTMLDVVRNRFIPNSVFVMGQRAQIDKELAGMVPWATRNPTKDDKRTAYVCERGACDLPTHDPEVFDEQVARLIPYGGPKSP